MSKAGNSFDFYGKTSLAGGDDIGHSDYVFTSGIKKHIYYRR